MADLVGDAFKAISGFAIADGSKRLVMGKKTEDKVVGAVEAALGTLLFAIARG